MNTSDEGRALIEAFEGLYLTAYRDEVGVLTIGYGHTNLAGVPPKVTPGQKITEEQADEILEADLAAVENNVAKCIIVKLAQCEFDALVSFDFNTGSLRKSSIDEKIDSGNKAAAMQTLLLYNHAGGNVLNGLTRRRKAEKMMFEGNVSGALALADVHKTFPPQPSRANLPPVAIPPPPDIEPPQPTPPPSGGFFVSIVSLLLKLLGRK